MRTIIDNYTFPVYQNSVWKSHRRNSPKRYPEKLRKICYYDVEQNRAFIFLTNDFTTDAKTITELYRKRWSIELFFKWIKQHLKIKQFWETTENAVKIQVNCAIIAYCLVAIVAVSKNRANYLRNSTDFRQIPTIQNACKSTA